MPPYGAKMGPEGGTWAPKRATHQGAFVAVSQANQRNPPKWAGMGRFGSFARRRGPLGQYRGRMLAIEAPKGPKKDNRWTTDISMARRLQQDFFMRRYLDNTCFYGKMFSTESFDEKTFGQHTFLW